MHLIEITRTLTLLSVLLHLNADTTIKLEGFYTDTLGCASGVVN